MNPRGQIPFLISDINYLLKNYSENIESITVLQPYYFGKYRTSITVDIVSIRYEVPNVFRIAHLKELKEATATEVTELQELQNKAKILHDFSESLHRIAFRGDISCDDEIEMVYIAELLHGLITDLVRFHVQRSKIKIDLKLSEGREDLIRKGLASLEEQYNKEFNSLEMRLSEERKENQSLRVWLRLSESREKNMEKKIRRIEKENRALIKKLKELEAQNPQTESLLDKFTKGEANYLTDEEREFLGI